MTGFLARRASTWAVAGIALSSDIAAAQHEGHVLPVVSADSSAWRLGAAGAGIAMLDGQSGPRGGQKIVGIGWIMAAAAKPLAGGVLSFRAMLSPDAAGTGPRGYPLLLQSGEATDRQHPHDFWSEVSVAFERPVWRAMRIAAYGGPSGEPALGPAAFVHRVSADENPAAPIGHHWQDATHVSFGVATVSAISSSWRVDASRFNGTEPDDNRWNFEPIRLDSYSMRLTVRPRRDWMLTGSWGTLAHPERSEPDVHVQRVVVSATHVGPDASSLIVGLNRSSSETLSVARWSPSLLAESQRAVGSRHAVFARFEYVSKTRRDLGIQSLGGGPATSYGVAATSLGWLERLGGLGHGAFGVGVSGTLNYVPAALAATYGSRTPLGAMVFVRAASVGPSEAPAIVKDN